MFHGAFCVIKDRVSRFELEAKQALLEANAPTRSPLRGNRSGMAIKRPQVQMTTKRKKQKKLMSLLLLWSECRDSNSRPLEPHSSAIPNFATPGYMPAFS